MKISNKTYSLRRLLLEQDEGTAESDRLLAEKIALIEKLELKETGPDGEEAEVANNKLPSPEIPEGFKDVVVFSGPQMDAAKEWYNQRMTTTFIPWQSNGLGPEATRGLLNATDSGFQALAMLPDEAIAADTAAADASTANVPLHQLAAACLVRPPGAGPIAFNDIANLTSETISDALIVSLAPNALAAGGIELGKKGIKRIRYAGGLLITSELLWTALTELFADDETTVSTTSFSAASEAAAASQTVPKIRVQKESLFRSRKRRSLISLLEEGVAESLADLIKIFEKITGKAFKAETVIEDLMKVALSDSTSYDEIIQLLRSRIKQLAPGEDAIDRILNTKEFTEFIKANAGAIFDQQFMQMLKNKMLSGIEINAYEKIAADFKKIAQGTSDAADASDFCKELLEAVSNRFLQQGKAFSAADKSIVSAFLSEKDAKYLIETSLEDVVNNFEEALGNSQLDFILQDLSGNPRAFAGATNKEKAINVYNLVNETLREAQSIMGVADNLVSGLENTGFTLRDGNNWIIIDVLDNPSQIEFLVENISSPGTLAKVTAADYVDAVIAANRNTAVATALSIEEARNTINYAKSALANTIDAEYVRLGSTEFSSSVAKALEDTSEAGALARAEAKSLLSFANVPEGFRETLWANVRRGFLREFKNSGISLTPAGIANAIAYPILGALRLTKWGLTESVGRRLTAAIVLNLESQRFFNYAYYTTVDDKVMADYARLAIMAVHADTYAVAAKNAKQVANRVREVYGKEPSFARWKGFLGAKTVETSYEAVASQWDAVAANLAAASQKLKGATPTPLEESNQRKIRNLIREILMAR